MYSPPTLERLIGELARLPGIGRKSARRLAYHILNQKTEYAQALAQAMVDAKAKIRPCARCRQYAEAELCTICSNPHREQNRICVVEKSADIEALESNGIYRGLYHVLGGTLSPLDGIGPQELHLPLLLERVQGGVTEIIFALGSSPEADSTVLLIDRMLGTTPIKKTRLARGIPMGSDLEYIDELTMMRAFEAREQI